MPFDFTVLGPDGAPEKTVSLGVGLHHELIQTASENGLALFEDFTDYYEDAEIVADAVPSLSVQAQALRACAVSAELQQFLDGLGQLLAYAILHGRSIHALAD